jgi:GNAT superfamily N-acetyltransferase
MSGAADSEGGRLAVRFARPADRDWCAAQDPHASPELLSQKIAAGEVAVAERDGRAVGYLRLEYLWATLPFISLIRVLEEERRQGVGRAILAFLEAALRGRGHDLLLSSSQVDEPSPQAWHRAVGFEECGILVGVNAGGVGEVFFRKRL